MTLEPERLIHEDAPSALGDLLRSAQADVLSDDAVDRMRSRLAAAGVGFAPAAPHAPHAPQPAAPTPALLGHVAAKIALGLVAVGVVVGGTFAATSSRRPLRLAPIQRSAEGFGNPIAVRALESPAPTSPARLLPDVPSPNASAIASVASTARAKAVPLHVAPAPSAKPAAVASTSASPSAREGALLLQARRALDADPARALELVTTHQAEFPDSQLAPERARIAAEARRRLQP